MCLCLVGKKTVYKMLVKWTKGVNFINILQTAFFANFLFSKKLSNKSVIREKLWKALLHKKGARKNVDEIDFRWNLANVTSCQTPYAISFASQTTNPMDLFTRFVF